MPKGLYIHIPFCDHICTYCDFPKLFTKGQNHEGYISALITELNSYYEREEFKNLKTIYIGGGTPTALDITQIAPLFDWLKEFINFDQIIEFTIEANPENLTKDKIMYYKSVGINRFSLGVQTFNPALLKMIGRKHDPRQVEMGIEQLKLCGIDNINVDLIYSIPGQTLDDLKRDIACVQALNVAHVSAYSLIVEEHTKLYLDYMRDKLELTDNELEAKMYEEVIQSFKALGYKHYEISNFSKNKPSYHNQWYWKNEEYYGVGLGAHGYVGGNRYQNTRSLPHYIKMLNSNNLPITESHVLSINEKIEEEMFLGLRLLNGINIEQVNEKYQIDVLKLYHKAFEKLISKEFLVQEGTRIRLTHKGLLMANEVFEEFLLSV